MVHIVNSILLLKGVLLVGEHIGQVFYQVHKRDIFICAEVSVSGLYQEKKEEI